MICRYRVPLAILAVLSLLCAPLAAQGSFRAGVPLSMASEGGIFTKPGYAQEGLAVPSGAVDAYFLYDLKATRGLMEEASGWDGAHVATAVAGSVLMIGGLATFIVAASGVSDYRGTISIYFTSAGLFLGSAGSWLGNWFCHSRRVALRREAVELYNRSLGQ